MKRFFFYALLGGIGSVWAEGFSTGTHALKSAVIKYSASHPLHSFSATSVGAAKGKVLCEKNQCELLVAVPVKSFDSENSNRDAHMLEITHGAEFPLIVFRLHFEPSRAPKDLTGEAEFSGHRHALNLKNLRWSEDAGLLKVEAEAAFQLKDFSIEAPALLGVEMSQDIQLNIAADFF